MKRYIQLDMYGRVVVEEEGKVKVVYIEWNSFPRLNPHEYVYEPHITKEVLGEAMVVTDSDMDVYACIEQARAYWAATE